MNVEIGLAKPVPAAGAAPMVDWRGMDPVIVEIGPVAIRWYGVLLAATIGLSMIVGYRLGPRLGVPTALLDRTAVTFALVALIGARVGYIVSHPSEFRRLVDIVRIDQGGLTSHGAIAAGLLYLVWIAHRERRSVWALADVFCWVIPIGNVLVRIGNFINGELYGDPTTLPWGVTFPGVPAPRHPLQLYEMVFAAIILAVTLPRAARRRFPGEMFWLVLTLTSIGRILLDLLRSEDRVLGVLTLGMIPAALLAIAGGWILLTKGRASAGPGRPAARTP